MIVHNSFGGFRYQKHVGFKLVIAQKETNVIVET